jgi:REP element-mobilizing transposase RayT
MAHRYANVIIHTVFSTKERTNSIPDDLQPKLWKYFAGIGANHELPILTSGGTANHAHVLLALPADMAVARAVQLLKANSSRWIGEHGIDFHWQEGYGAFSVSTTNVDAVRHYIAHQAEHHRSHSYEDEFLGMLRRAGVAFSQVEVFA